MCREQRGTVAALAHPAIIAHLKKLHGRGGTDADRRLDRRAPSAAAGAAQFLGLQSGGDDGAGPRPCPGGVAELRETVAALHAAGIGVILDLVFNHSGESDTAGAVLSLRGLDNAAYAQDENGALINDTGCGNTLDFANACVRAGAGGAAAFCGAWRGGRVPLRSGAGARQRWTGRGLIPPRRSLPRSPPIPGWRTDPDRRAVGHRAGRLSVGALSGELAGMERCVPR
jgi:hypothetical protein